MKTPSPSFFSIDENGETIFFKLDVFKLLLFLPAGIEYASIHDIFLYGV